MPSLPIPCSGCGHPRKQGGRVHHGVCRKCWKKARAEAATRLRDAAVATRAVTQWLKPDERPRCEGLSSGTVTKFGTVQARGIRDGKRYYDLIDAHGERLTLPAERVEAAA